MFKWHIPEAFYNSQSWPSFSTLSNVTNMTTLDLSIMKVQNIVFQIFFQDFKE